MNKPDWSFKVSLPHLRKSMFGKDIIPLDARGVHFVTLHRREYNREVKEFNYVPIGQFKVEVVAPTHRRTHRLMVQCDCGKNIPVGRLHQHANACKSNIFK